MGKCNCDYSQKQALRFCDICNPSVNKNAGRKERSANKNRGEPMLKQLLAEKTDISARMADLKKEMADCQELINNIIIAQVEQARLSQGKDTGAINIFVDGVDVRHTLPKKIVWDQVKLSAIFEKIRAVAEDPTDYMSVKFSVSEKNYKQFTPEIKEHFKPARTVETGSPKIELKIREES